LLERKGRFHPRQKAGGKKNGKGNSENTIVSEIAENGDEKAENSKGC